MGKQGQFISTGAILCLIALVSVASLTPLPTKAQSLGAWTNTTHYPISVAELSCNVSNGFIYCVGGEFNSKNTNASYYAPISSSGTGAWTKTTDYPIGIDIQSCVASGAFIYCVGGYDRASDTFTKSVYFAAVSSSGIGAWNQTTAYPLGVAQQSCDTSGGFVYCVGGEIGVYGNVTKAVYFAAVSSSGVGTWIKMIDYPTSVSVQSCDTSDGFIYCVGGAAGAFEFPTNAVYYAPVSASGVGEWAQSTAYPISIITHSCGTHEVFIYCVGGFDNSGAFVNSVYYSSIRSAPNTSTSTITTSPTSTATSASSSTTASTSEAASTSSTTTSTGPTPISTTSTTSPTSSTPTSSTQQTTSNAGTGTDLTPYLVLGVAVAAVGISVGVLVIRRRH